MVHTHQGCDLFLALLSAPQSRGKLLAPHCWTDTRRNQAEPGYKSLENFFYYLPSNDEKWIEAQQASVLCTLKMSGLGLFSSRKPGNHMSNVLSALTTYAMLSVGQEYRKQRPSGILVSALRQGSKCKLKTGVKRIVERIILLKLVTYTHLQHPNLVCKFFAWDWMILLGFE